MEAVFQAIGWPVFFDRAVATSDGRSTSVGSQAIFRFARPVCYQDFPDSALPQDLRDGNPLGIWRMIDGEFMRGAVGVR